MKKTLISSIFILIASTAMSQKISLGIAEHKSALNNFVKIYERDIVAKTFAYNYSLSTLGIEYDWKREKEAKIAQLGDGIDLLNIYANSYLNLSSKNKVWGAASYNTGTKHNLMWNSTSDYELLYPYILADQIGGDMKTEQYYFSGGYSHIWDKWNFSIDGAYRALHEYRQIDPRPRNISSELKFASGVGYAITKNKVIGLTAFAQIYKQNGSLSFYSESGVEKEYQMTGLGSIFHRFSGDVTSLLHQGLGWGANLSFFDKQRKGLSALVSYKHFGVDRIAKGFNNLDLTRQIKDEIFAEISYLKHTHNKYHGLSLNVDFRHNQGLESVVGDATSGIYPIAMKQNMYLRNYLNTSIEYMIGFVSANKHRYTIKPAIAYELSQEKYIFPNKTMKYSNVVPKLDFVFEKFNSKISYQAKLGALYTINTNKSLSLPVVNMEQWIVGMLNKQLVGMATSFYQINLGFAMDWVITKKLSIFCNVDYITSFVNSKQNLNLVQVSTGINF